MLTESRNRVRDNTEESVNRSIDDTMRARVRRIASEGPQAIRCRLRELDLEWDIERVLETMAPTMSLMGMILSMRSRGWLLLPLVVQAFFLQHAVQGWCPPMPVLRRLGFRTESEINEERHALKALRGDYADAEKPRENASDRAVAAARG